MFPNGPAGPQRKILHRIQQVLEEVDSYGRVVQETVGDPGNGIGGTYQYAYSTSGLPDNIIDPNDPIVFRCTLTDRNGNERIYDFNGNNMTVRVELDRNRARWTSRR